MRIRVYILGFLIALIPSVIGGFGVALLWEFAVQRNAVLAYEEAAGGTTNRQLTCAYRWVRRAMDDRSTAWYAAWPIGKALRAATGTTGVPQDRSFWARAERLLYAGAASLPAALFGAIVLAGPIVERTALLLARRTGRWFVPLPVGGRSSARRYLAARLRGALLGVGVVGLVSLAGPLLIGTAHLHSVAGGAVWLSAMAVLGLVCAMVGGAWRCYPRRWSPGDLWTCSRCRYQVSATFPPRCPECGLESGGVARPARPLAFPARWRPYAVIFALSAAVVVVHRLATTPPARSVLIVRLSKSLPTELVWRSGVRATIVPPGASGRVTSSGAVWKCVWHDVSGATVTQAASRLPATFLGPRGCEVDYSAGIPTDGAVVYGGLDWIGRSPTERTAVKQEARD